jgi:hypothetical protein
MWTFVAGLNRIMGFHPAPLDNWIAKDNHFHSKRTHYHKNDMNMDMDSAIAGSVNVLSD